MDERNKKPLTNSHQKMKTLKLLTLLLLTLPAVVQAQFTFTTNNGAITITGYTGNPTTLNIPSMTNGYPVTTIGTNAFIFCQSLTNITIPNSVACIDGYAFYYCSNLRTITIPSSVTNFGYSPFFLCYSLTNISVDEANPSFTSVGGVLFDKTLTTLVEYPGGLVGSYTIPNSVSSICEQALGGGSLTSVTIASSVNYFGAGVFTMCPNLRQVYFLGNAPSVDGGAGSADTSVFMYTSGGTVYYLPGTTGWSSTFGGWPTAKWYRPRPTILGNSSGLGAGSNGFQFTVSWATNASVVVEASTNLLNWSPVITNALVNGTNGFSDASWTNYSGRFYRVRSP